MEKQLIPQLRFPEFDGQWENKKLSNVAVFLDNKRKPIKSADRAKMQGEYPYYGASGIIDYVNQYIFDDELILLGEDGENILSRNSPLAYRVSGKCWINNHAHVLKPIDGINIDFLTESLELVNYSIYNTGTAQPKLNKEICKSVPLKFPQLPEQQKIAAFLKDVDDKFTKLTKKKELLEQYKKGIMQKIFNQELRFKDDNGNAFPNWVEKKLGDLGGTLNGLTGKTKENFGSGKPYIQYKQIFDSSKINIDNCGLVDITITDKQTKVQYGDVFFTTSSETPNEIGTASVLLDSVDEMYLNSFCFGFRVNQSVLYPSFSQFLFRSSDFRKKMIPLAQGSTRYNISKSSFVKLKVSLPSIAEQTKIANFLSDIDKKIEALNTKIENSKSFKKGLLQKMFV